MSVVGVGASGVHDRGMNLILSLLHYSVMLIDIEFILICLAILLMLHHLKEREYCSGIFLELEHLQLHREVHFKLII